MNGKSSPPIVGILTTPDDSRHFRGNRSNFMDIIRMGQELGIPVYVVTTRDLNLRQRKIHAFEYDTAKQEWKQATIPLPQVLYNRIPTREEEHMPDIRNLLQECANHPGMRLYNPAFFNKWHLFEWLWKSKVTRRHIPETRRYNSSMKLIPMLKKHHFLYLKPERGKAGVGIMRIRRNPHQKQGYILNTQESKTSQTQRFDTVVDLKGYLSSLIGDEQYIIQQGVVLANSNQRPFDLRVLVQKNKHGRWLVTGIGARVAGEASITTHVPRGGSIDSPLKLLSHVFGGRRARRMMLRTQQTALIIARQIEKASGHQLGEMSMDLGVDRVGRLWFFEANSKPMKFDEPHIRQKSLQRLLEYCQYLSRKQLKTGTRG